VRPDATDATTARLRAAGCVFAEEEAALLAAEAQDAADLERLLVARASGLPLEQVLGWAGLDGRRYVVEPGVFVPRKRSLLLLHLAAQRLRPRTVVVDLCCGTGALGAALLAREPGIEVHAADLDPAAVTCARRNLPPDRVYAGDLFDALPGRLRGRTDVIVANAPYVPTRAIASMPPEARDHEHAVALDGGPDGLDVQRRLVADAPAWLAPGGLLLVETGRDQAECTAALVADAGLAARVHHDDEIGGCAVSGERRG
jgi:release factor glutamine methyltransferase